MAIDSFVKHNDLWSLSPYNGPNRKYTIRAFQGLKPLGRQQRKRFTTSKHMSGTDYCQIFIVHHCEWLLLIEALAEAFSCLWSESSLKPQSEQIHRWLFLLIWTKSPFDKALCKWTTQSWLADYPAMLQKGIIVLILRRGSHQCSERASRTIVLENDLSRSTL